MDSIRELLTADHRHCDDLFADVERLAAKAAWGEAQPAFDRLAQAMRQHFDAEERILRESGYPQLEAHQLEHDALRGRLTDILYEAIHGPLDPAVLPPLAREMVLDHLRDYDQAFKSFLTRQNP